MRRLARPSPTSRKIARQRRRVAAVAALAGVAGLLKLSGAVNSWTNTGGDGSWANVLNWSTHHAPYAGDNLLLGDAGTTGHLALDGSFTAGTLSFGTTHAITVDANIVAGNLRTLTLTGGTNAVGGTAALALSSATPGAVTLGPAGELGMLALTLPASATIAVPNAAADLVVGPNAILRAASATKSGAGTLTVEGDLLATGSFTISGGQVVLKAPTRATATVTTAASASLLISDSHALQYASLSPSAGVQFAAGVGTVTVRALSGSGNLALQDTAGEPVTLEIAGGNGLYTGTLSGPGGLTKIALNNPLLPAGTLTGFTLARANTYTGPTTVSGSDVPYGIFTLPTTGELLLDFAASGAPLSNIISPSSALRLGGSDLAGGGLLDIHGGFAKNTTQAFASTAVREGASLVLFNRDNATSLSGALGPLTREGGTLTVRLPANGTVTAAAPLSHGIIGGWATIANSAGSPTDWATVSGGNLVAYSGYTNLAATALPSDPALNGNLTAVATYSYGDGGTVTDVNTLRTQFIPQAINAATDASRLRFGAGGGLLQMASLGGGYILTVGSAVGNGSLTAGGADNLPGELFLITGQLNPFGPAAFRAGITVNSAIIDNGTGVVSVSKSGAGVLMLNNPNNTYTGGTVVNLGRIEAGSAVGALGRTAAGTAGGDVTIKAGGQVHLTGGTWDNRFSISGTGSGDALGHGALWLGNATLTGDIRLNTNAQIYSDGAGIVSGVISGPGALLSSGAGTTAALAPLFTNPANTFTGGIGISFGALAFSSSGAMGIDTRRNVLMSSGTIVLTFPGVQEVLNRRFAPDVAGTLALTAGNSGESIDFSPTGANLLGLFLSGSGTVTYTGNHVPYGGTYRFGGGGGTFTYAPNIVGASSVIFGSSSSSTMILAGHNTYTGSTTFAAGKAVTGDLNDFGTGPLIFSGGTLALTAPVDISTRSTTFTAVSFFATSTIDLGTNDVTFAHPVGGGGAGGMTKAGTGTLTLNAANDYLGTTTISAGTLVANVSGALPAGSRLALNYATGSTAVLLLGADQSVGNLPTDVSSSFGHSLIKLNGHQLAFGSDNSDGTIYSAVQGVGALTKLGNGTTSVYNQPGSLGATTNYTGTVEVKGGVLQLAFQNVNTTVLTSDILPASNPLSLAGGTLGVTNGTSGAVSQSFEQTTVNPGASSVRKMETSQVAVAIALGNLSRPAAGGTVDFTGDTVATFTTKTANTGGTILGGWATFAGSTQFAVSAGDGTNPGAITGLANGGGSFASGGNVDATGSGNSALGPINSLRFTGSGFASLDTSGGLNILTGGILLAPGLTGVTFSGGTLTSGNGTDLIVTSNGVDLTVGARVTGGIGITKTGLGVLTLSNTSNSFSGPININGGTLQVVASSALGGNPIFLNGNGGAAAQITIASGVSLNNPITISGPHPLDQQGSITALGPAILNSPVTFSSDVQQSGSVTATFAGPLTVNGTVTAPAGVVVSSRDDGVVLKGGGNYTRFAVRAGTTSLGANNGMGTAAVLDVQPDGYVAAFDLKGFSQTLAGLTQTNALGGTITNSTATLSTLTLNVPAGRAESTSAALTGSLALIKTGAGTQKLTGVNTMSGFTNVSDGTLVVDGSLANSLTTVAGNGVLQGIGTVGSLVVNNGGTLAPSDGLGTLRTGNLQLAADGHLVLELATSNDCDLLSVTGTVSLLSDVQISLSPNFGNHPGEKFFIVLNDGSDPVSGAFSNDVISDAFGRVFSVNYADDGDGGPVANDVSLTVIAVPEPSALGLWSAAGLLLGVRRSRRQQSSAG